MKLYKISQDNLTILGFSPNQIDQKHFFNKNNLMTFIVCGLCSILTFLFLIFEAKIFVEYVESTYILSAAIGCTVALASLRVKTLSQYIAEFEKIVNSSEYAHLFSKKFKKLYTEFLIVHVLVTIQFSWFFSFSKNRTDVGIKSNLR